MKSFLFIALLLVLCISTRAQVHRNSDLYRALKNRDSLLFDRGFNNCDIAQLQKIVSDSFEFYHDQAGTMTSKAAFISSIEDGICKLSYKAIRQLDEPSLTVFPLKKNGQLYGALQMGVHRFYAREGGKPERLTSTARFTNLWLLENGEWKLSRSFSYDHR